MKEAPFYVGQKIVRTGNTIAGICEHGKTYTTLICVQCPACKDWKVSCEEFPKMVNGYRSNPCLCGCNFDVSETNELLVGRAKLFAPIEENTYENISKELAVLPQDEVPDVKIKELVN